MTTGRLTGLWRTAPFRRAPLLLAKHPSVAGAVAGAAAVLALTGAAAPLFVASAASASVDDQVAGRCSYTQGLAAFGPLATARRPDTTSRAAFERLARTVPRLEPTVLTTIVGGSSNPVFLARGAGVDFPVTLVERSGQERNITIVSDAHRDGLLLPDGLAATLHVSAGDQVRITSADSRPVPVAAVYRDLNTEPKRAYWCDPVLRAYSKGLLDDNPPPPLVLARGAAVRQALAGTGIALESYYERAVTRGMTLPQA